MVILLQYGNVEAGGREVFFQACYEKLNKGQYFLCPFQLKEALAIFVGCRDLFILCPKWIRLHMFPKPVRSFLSFCRWNKCDAPLRTHY